jgi:ATP-binding cassette, subfamily B, bacterial
MPSGNLSLKNAIGRLHRLLLLDGKDISVIYFLAIFAGLVQLSLPLGIQSIVSFVLAGSISTSITVLICLVVSGVFINGLLQIRQLQILEKVKQKLFARYSMEYADRLPQLNIEKLDRVYLPEMVNRFFDTVSLQKGINKLVTDLPAAVVQVLLGIVLLSFYHPVFIAFGILLLLIIALLLYFTTHRGLSSALAASGYKYELAAWLQEIARTIKTFKYAKSTSLHIRKTDDLLNNYLRSRTTYFKVLLNQFWSLVSFKIIITAAMLILGAYLLVNQQINVGQFIAADIVIIAIIGSIEKIITNLDTVYDALVSLEKLSTVTEAEKEKSGTCILAADNEGVSIGFDRVSFAYGDQPKVLQDFSFTAAKGEMVQLKGLSGAGKSTVLRLLTGAFTNYEGNILIEGIPARNYAVQRLRELTGIILGSQDIFPGTLLQNITMGNASISIGEVQALAEKTGLSSFVQKYPQGYDTFLQSSGIKLPNSVRKNILLLRALLGHHRLLLLEEPFEHLEEPYKTNTIRFIKARKSCTVLIASQDPALEAYCNKVITLNKIS